jgi:hypothetical protein
MKDAFSKDVVCAVRVAGRGGGGRMEAVRGERETDKTRCCQHIFQGKFLSDSSGLKCKGRVQRKRLGPAPEGW